MTAKLRNITWKAGLLAMLKAFLAFGVVMAASGGLDTTFSGDGKQTTDMNAAHPGWDDRVFGLAIQTDGKIVAAGYTTDYTTTADIAVARYNANGTRDTTFSGDGKLTTDLGAWDYAYGVALQSNGKIVVVGTKCTDSTGTSCNLVVLRYNTNGTLDTTFNATGKKLAGFSGESSGSSGGVAIQSDGKIVAGGGVGNTADTSDMAVFRFNTNGSLDTTFSGDGKQRINFGVGSSDSAGWGRNVAIQSNGKIVISGGAGDNFAVARLNSNGTLDTTFSGDGRQITSFGATAYSQALALQPDGKIVAAGWKDTGTASTFAIARYNTNGTLDTTFNGTGKRQVDFAGDAHEVGESVVVQSNGKIVIAGNAAELNGGDFAIARLNANGTLDTTFSGDARATFDFAAGLDRCRALALDANGKYVLGGFATNGGQLDFALMRVLP